MASAPPAWSAPVKRSAAPGRSQPHGGKRRRGDSGSEKVGAPRARTPQQMWAQEALTALQDEARLFPSMAYDYQIVHRVGSRICACGLWPMCRGAAHRHLRVLAQKFGITFNGRSERKPSADDTPLTTNCPRSKQEKSFVPQESIVKSRYCKL